MKNLNIKKRDAKSTAQMSAEVWQRKVNIARAIITDANMRIEMYPDYPLVIETAKKEIASSEKKLAKLMKDDPFAA